MHGEMIIANERINYQTRSTMIEELEYLAERKNELLKQEEIKPLSTHEAKGQYKFLLRSIIDFLPYAISIKNAKARIIFSNSADVKRHGFTYEEEIIGKTAFDLYPEEIAKDQYDDDMSVLKTGKPVFEREEILVDEEGQRHWILISKYPIWNESKRIIGLVGTVRDITDPKNAYDALVNTCKELQQFTYVASHDLQEPLRVVNSYMELLLKRYEDQLDEKGQKYINRAIDATTRMKKLINDLLLLTGVDSKTKEFKRIIVGDLIDDIVENFGEKIKDKKAIITYVNLPEIMGDKTQIRQLFKSLINNAIKFTKESQIPEVNITAQHKGSMVEFKIEDNGIGIDKKHINRIFMIFQRLHSRSEYDGTGIGLALCKKIVERHNGSMKVESVLNQGSTFYCSLPIYK